jgi:hypothetical protein
MGIVPLLFAVNVATGLPPQALQFSPTRAWPTIRPRTHGIIEAPGLAVMLGRPVMELGRGCVVLGDVDERLRGLLVSLDVFRVIDWSGALVSIGVVRSDPVTPGGTSIADLWTLAREAIVQHGIEYSAYGGVGDAAFLANFGKTVQLAWMTGDRLATVSVSCIDGGQHWMRHATRAVAGLIESRLRSPVS